MANRHFIVNHDDVHPNTGGAYWGVWVCDTYAGRPVTGLVVGELGIMLDQGAAYYAVSTTSWGGKVNVAEATTLALILGAAGNQVYLVGDGVAGLSLQVLPTDPGGTLISNYLAQTLYAKTLEGVLISGSGTGVVRIGEWGGSNAYGAIGMAGSVATNDFNFLSSPGDTNLYINRPAGKDMIFDLAATPQMTLPSGAPITTIPTLRGNGASPPAASEMGIVSLSSQAAVIGSTNLTNATPAGMYRAGYYLEVTTGDALATGTITANVIATDGVDALTQSSAALVLTGTGRTSGSFMVRLASGNITWSTTGITLIGNARYALRLRCEYLG